MGHAEPAASALLVMKETVVVEGVVDTQVSQPFDSAAIWLVLPALTAYKGF